METAVVKYLSVFHCGGKNTFLHSEVRSRLPNEEPVKQNGKILQN